ncbi:MAG: hypothetical protein HY817_02545 [Candidatus Abawacabacteria bacterium]|nr:hypothetical protein [Candidatus Abawacabacteria bacterium]
MSLAQSIENPESQQSMLRIVIAFVMIFLYQYPEAISEARIKIKIQSMIDFPWDETVWQEALANMLEKSILERDVDDALRLTDSTRNEMALRQTLKALVTTREAKSLA